MFHYLIIVFHICFIFIFQSNHIRNCFELTEYDNIECITVEILTVSLIEMWKRESVEQLYAIY